MIPPIGAKLPPPALAKRTSSRPFSSSICAKSLCQASSRTFQHALTKTCTLQRWPKPALTSCLISLSFVWIHHRESIIKSFVSQVAMENDTRDPQPFEFRSPRGVRKIESHSRSWNGITVRNIVHHLDHGNVWHDISSRETTVAIVLEQIGGFAASISTVRRLDLASTQAMPLLCRRTCRSGAILTEFDQFVSSG